MATLARHRRQPAGGSFAQASDADWSRGMVRDAPRTAIPPGGVYDSADFLLHQPGMAIKRGGSSYAGPALASSSYANGVAYAEFPAGAKLVGIGAGTANLYTVTAGTTTNLGGSTVVTADNPKLRIGGGKNLLVFTQNNGTSGPVKYDGSAAPAALGGSPPAGRFAEVYKTRLVLGGNNANPNRTCFSPTPDIESTWDTANSWVDHDYQVTGYAALQDMLLVFSRSHTERLLGTTPPPGGDMDKKPVGAIGCTDARSIVVYKNTAIFANPRGVYVTGGAGFDSLTEMGQIDSYWQSLFSGYDPSTWWIAAGLFKTFYVVNILNASGVLVAMLMCDIPRRSWWRVTNHIGTMFATAAGIQEKLYMADASANARIVDLSGFLVPAAGNKLDANNVAVAPVLETRLLGANLGPVAFGHGFLSYDLRDAATDNPTLAVAVAPGVEATTYTAAAESPFPETTDETRRRFSVNRDAQGFSVKVTQSGPSAKTELYGFDWEQRPYSAAADGQ